MRSTVLSKIIVRQSVENIQFRRCSLAKTDRSTILDKLLVITGPEKV